MRSQQSLIALSALLLCALQQRAASGHSSPASSTPAPSSEDVGTPRSRLSESSRSRTPLKAEEATNNSTVIDGSSAAGASPLCAYRVVEGGVGGRLCFRNTLYDYKCSQGDCWTELSTDNLVANILLNGSVLLQWRQDEDNTTAAAGSSGAGPGTNVTKRGDGAGGQGRRRRGYELSCWWNGSYTQFECAGALLGPGCRDFLLTELHHRIPYRVCLRPLARSSTPQEVDRQSCVEFTLSPSGMQDIVIAMTTVGGAICVMLVIICLLVAYITENIMSPTTQHTHSHRARSHH